MWRRLAWIHAIISVSVVLRNETVFAQEVNDDICHGALLLADVNNDDRVDRDEFPYFAILLSNNESCQLVEGVFEGLACLCRRFDDQPRNCCQRNNAHISLLALTQAEPTVNQQMALRATCQVAGQAIQAAGCVDTLFNQPNQPSTTSPTLLQLPNDPTEPPDASTPTLASTSTTSPTYTASTNAPSWFPLSSASPTTQTTTTLSPTTIPPTTLSPSTLSPTQNVGTTLDSTVAAAAASSSSNRLSGIVITAIVMLCMAALAVLWHFGSKYHWSFWTRPYQNEQDEDDVERRGAQKIKTHLVAESMPTHVTHSPTALHHDNDSIGESHLSLAEMSVLSYPAERSPLVGHHRRVVSEESCEIYADDDSDDEEGSNVIRAETCSSSSEFKDASSSDGSLPSELSKGRSLQEQTSWDPSWEGVMSLVESTDEEGFRANTSVHQGSMKMNDKDENVQLDDDYHSSSSLSLQPSSQNTDASLQDDTVHSMVQEQPTFLMDGRRRIYNSFSTDGAISSSPTPYEDYSYAASKASFDDSEAGRSQPSRNADPRESHSRTIPENTTNRHQTIDEDRPYLTDPRTTAMKSHYEEQPPFPADDEEEFKQSFSNCDESTMSSPQSTFFPQRPQVTLSQDDRERFSKSRSYKEEANEELASILERIKNKRTRHPQSDVSRNEEHVTESFVPSADPSTDTHLGMAVKPMQSTSDEAHRELASILERIEEKKRARNQQTQLDATVAKTQVDKSVSEKDALLEMAIKPSLSSSKEAHEELASILERIEKKRARNRQLLESSEEKVNSSSLQTPDGLDDMTGRSIYSSRSTKRKESSSKGEHVSVTNEKTTRRRRKPKMPDIALDKDWKQPHSKAKETKQDYRGNGDALLFQSPGSFASSVAPSMDDGSSLDVSNSSEVLLEERRYERSQRKAKKKRDTPDHEETQTRSAHEETQTRSASRNDTEAADSDPNSGDSVDHIVGSIDNIVGSIDNMIGYNLT